MIEYCDCCGAAQKWIWEEAFDKFGFGDGDGLIMTSTVADALTEAGYAVECGKWGLHNEIITAITKDGTSLIPASAQPGYDNPRDYLPKDIVALLDAAFPGDELPTPAPDKRITQWLALGYANLWISQAVDPPFTQASFHACAGDDELADKLLTGNWSLGQAFHLENLCFIQQVNGGDEWLVIKEDQAFESFSCIAMGREKLLDHIRRIRAATLEQCTSLTY